MDVQRGRAPIMLTVTIGAELVDRATRLLDAAPGRICIGITGPPAAGKSLLGQALARAVEATSGIRSVGLPMDGFHLTNAILEARGLTALKGTAQSFDAAGFVESLARVCQGTGQQPWPEYSRVTHDPISGALTVPEAVQLVFVEATTSLSTKHLGAMPASILPSSGLSTARRQYCDLD